MLYSLQLKLDPGPMSPGKFYFQLVNEQGKPILCLSKRHILTMIKYRVIKDIDDVVALSIWLQRIGVINTYDLVILEA